MDDPSGDGLSKAELDASIETLKVPSCQNPRCRPRVADPAHARPDPQALAGEIGAEVIPLRTKVEKEGEVAEVLVRTRLGGDDFRDIRVAVVGNVDAGKRFVFNNAQLCLAALSSDPVARSQHSSRGTNPR